MEHPHLERRLAAILAADVAGYSRLTGADEERTLGRLKALRHELIDPAIAAARGRIVKTTGDGILAEFPSVVDAVRCAIEVQRGMAQRNAGLVSEQRIEFRIGIHVGDVVVDGDDLLGDGVNIAARLEGIAEAGGIVVSEDAWRQVEGKVAATFTDRGEQSLKNIARPVRVFSVAIGATASTTAADAASPPRLSIVVLPFASLGGDPSQDFLADILTEEITTYLSRIPDSFVIARSTAFTFKGKPVDVKRIGKELGVRYVLEGSVQPGASRVRMNAQLIDADTGAHLWAERFDAPRGELMDMQDEIVTRIARTLHIRLSAIDAARLERVQPENQDAEVLAMRAEAAFFAHGILPRDETRAFMRLCEEALARDPNNIRALATLSHALGVNALLTYGSDPEEDARRADELSARAIVIDPDHCHAHQARSVVLQIQRRYAEAIVEAERALELNPGHISAYIGLGLCYAALGRTADGLAQTEKAIRLSPRDPTLHVLYGHKGILHFLLGQDEDAIEALGRSTALRAESYYGRAFLAAVLALNGRVAEAREHLTRCLPTITLKTVAAWQAQEDARFPAYPAARARLYQGLRLAGMPES